jgi:hypothetical protein
MRKLFVLAILIATSACASPYVAVPYEADQQSVTTITLIENVGDADVIAWEVASMGSNFGLVGALIDAGVQSSRRARVSEILEAAEFDAQDYFKLRLTEELEALGYAVTTAPVNERDGIKLLASHPGSNDDTVVYLDAVLRSFGFISSGAGTPFRPHASAEAQLVTANENNVLMRNSVIYGGLGTPQGHIILSPSAEYVYNNREELLAEPERLVAAVQTAISETATTIARLLAT